MMEPRTIQADWGIAYTLRDDFRYGPGRNGHRFRILYLEGPDGHEFRTVAIATAAGTGPIYVPGAELAPPFERSIPTLWEHVEKYGWRNLETGERAILLDGVPAEPLPPVPAVGEVPADLEDEDGDPCIYEHCATCDRAKSCELAKI
jgi:hypothetical protein